MYCPISVCCFLWVPLDFSQQSFTELPNPYHIPTKGDFFFNGGPGGKGREGLRSLRSSTSCKHVFQLFFLTGVCSSPVAHIVLGVDSAAGMSPEGLWPRLKLN